MKKRENLWRGLLFSGVITVFAMACQDDMDGDLSEIDDPLMEVAELSSQLSTGTDLSFANRGGQGPQGMGFGGRPEGVQNGGYGRPGMGQGMRFQQYNDDPNLLVISIADRIGDRLNFWTLGSLGASVTHFDENGLQVEIAERPERGAWRNGDGPKIAQTIVDFGSELSVEKGDVALTLSGKMAINRSFSDNELTEALTFEGFKINGASIEGTKTSVRAFDEENGQGRFTSSISNGAFIFNDGSTAIWASSKSREIDVTLNENGGRPLSASSVSESETILTKPDGSTLYSHKTESPILTDMSCAMGRGRKPISGRIEAQYAENTLEIDFGSGDCSDTITIMINGETVTRRISG